mgnify:CR=1 FL=1
MEILQLDGLEPQLFNLIGPLAMNPKVLRANNNYPFKNDRTFFNGTLPSKIMT